VTVGYCSRDIVHPIWVRITHWINAAAIILMIGSGWTIYNASPLFPFVFPVGIAHWLPGALLVHFAAMWLLVVTGLIYLTLGIASGRLLHKLFPIRLSDVLRDLRAAFRGLLKHEDLSVYNAVQRLLYVSVIVASLVAVLSGISIWKPVQCQELTAVFGGYDAARFVHFFAMAVIVGFLLIHVAAALIVPKSLRAMIFGR
jgi:thiosulfate reductase cytochrome b subunit